MKYFFNVLIASIINLQPESEDNIINFVIDNADNDLIYFGVVVNILLGLIIMSTRNVLMCREHTPSKYRIHSAMAF